MLLEEQPGVLIAQTAKAFSVVNDKSALARVNDSLATLNQARDLRLREAEDALKRLTRTLTTLQSSHAETLSTHSPTAHSSHIATLDTTKFRTAKSISSLETENDRLSSQLALLQERLQELELQGVEGAPEAVRTAVEDEVLLKLKVYRSLGVEVEREGGEWRKAVVKGRGKGDVKVVIVEKRFSKFFYANYFWDAM